ncbi:MAG: hypothetical protein ACREVQ_11515 [Burkholderiales bacterium]
MNRRTVLAWFAILALAMQALWPLAAAATAATSDVCSLAGSAPMPDPKSPACRLHCATCVPGAGQAALDTPAALPILVERPALRVQACEDLAPIPRLEVFAAPARAPPAIS